MFEQIKDVLVNFKLSYLVDITIIALIIYQLYKLVKQTRAEQLTKGFLALLIVTKLSDVFHLYTLRWLIENLFNVGLIALVVVFQPELRRGLEYIGRMKFFSKSISEFKKENFSRTVNEIVDACLSLSRQKIGALIVIERKTGLNEIVDTGTDIDGLVSSDLLINIFIPNTPLHDGAVVIKSDKIRAAACFLPLTDNQNVPRELGTRHRAALGVTEMSDALAVIVSEETGAISTAEEGVISRYLDENTLREKLLSVYLPESSEDKALFKWRAKDEDQDEEVQDQEQE